MIPIAATVKSVVEREAMKIMLSSLEELLFRYLPSKLDVKELRDVLEATMEWSSSSLVKRIKEIIGERDPFTLVKAYFNFYKLIGRPFEYEVRSKKPLEVVIKKCPYEEYTKSNPIACAMCLGALAGLLKEAFGSVRVEGGPLLVYGPENAKALVRRKREGNSCVISLSQSTGP